MSRRKKIDPNINPETGRGWGIDENGNCTENADPSSFFIGQAFVGLFCVLSFGLAVMGVEQIVYMTTGNDFGFTHSIGTYESR